MAVQAGKKVPLSPVTFRPVTDNPSYQHQHPRCIVKIDGNSYFGASFDYTQNAHGATDTATVVLPIDGKANFPNMAGTSLYPDWTKSIERSDRLGNANQPVLVEIWSGQPIKPQAFSPKNHGLHLRFRGVVDQYSADLEANETTFQCRSYAAPLTMTKITTPFPDEASATTVAFIRAQAARFGLTVAPPLLAAAPAKVIEVLGGEFISGVHDWFIWDLMLRCAQTDGVDIWVDRTGTIHYEAASLVKRQPIYFNWGQNCKGIVATHSPQFSKNVVVQVHSYQPRTRTASVHRIQTTPDGGTQEASYTRQSSGSPIFGTTESVITSISPSGTVTTEVVSSGGGAASGSSGIETEGGKAVYPIYLKNASLAQCQAMAQKIWRDISEHEYAITLKAPVTPADLAIMDVTAELHLSGHPMANFNGRYFPREINESFNVHEGWSWTIDALNHPLAQGAV